MVSYLKTMQYPVKFSLPHKGYQWLQWSWENRAFHPGIDLNEGAGDEDLGNSVYTPFKSKVEYISPAATRANAYNGGYGNYVVLYHPSFSLWSKYAHLNKIIDIPLGVELYTGVYFADVGKTGTKSAHLHWELFGQEMYDIQKNYRKNGVTLPFRYYPSLQTKTYIRKYYLNPMQFMEEHLPSPWATDDWSWAQQNGLVNEKSLPRDNMTTERFIVLLKNYHDKFKK